MLMALAPVDPADTVVELSVGGRIFKLAPVGAVMEMVELVPDVLRLVPPDLNKFNCGVLIFTLVLVDTV